MEEQQPQTSKAPRRRTKNANRLYAVLAFIVFVVLIVTISRAVFNHKKESKAPPVAVVRITHDGFQPATLSVAPGTRVTWTNTDQDLHQVVANPFPKGTDLRSLRSEILTNQQTYTYKADKSGTFGYHDQLNPTLNGTLIVKKK